MKTIRTIAILLSIMGVCACNNQPGTKEVSDTSIVKKPTPEKSVVEKHIQANRKELKLCDDLVTEIVTTSPRFKKITKGLYKAVVKNGGQSFGIRLEGSPNPGQGKSRKYSKTYDFTIYEIYPDRQLNTARFSFNPGNKKLYEYDEVYDRMNPIEFDNNILLKYDTLCK